MVCVGGNVHESGEFAAARDCYDEGVETVRMVRAFGIVFDAYTRFEEALIKAKVAVLEDEEEGRDGDGGEDSLAAKDVDLHMERLDALLARRELCLNSVKLRQDPDDVDSWMERIRILERDVEGKRRKEGDGGAGGHSQEDNSSDDEDGDVVLMSEEALDDDPIASCYACNGDHHGVACLRVRRTVDRVCETLRERQRR